MQYYSDKVRTIRNGDDMFVEVLKDDQWTLYWSTNERSNDYAYTELKNMATSVASKLKMESKI